MAKATPIKNRSKERRVFARVAKKIHPKNITLTNTRGGRRM